jgi:demethylmenaquinone methyltransferase/2-methoxy-6-polyprenyl-1,4-benzoquinol methylase
MPHIIENTITPQQAQRFYDRLGKRHDIADLVEAHAKRRGLNVLDLQPGHAALNVGLGSGLEYLDMITRVGPAGFVAGLDLSSVMLRVSRQRAILRCGEQQPALVLANALQLPYADASFDRLFSSYMLDLLPTRHIPTILSEFLRVLRPGGRMALVSFTEGEMLIGQGITAVWKRMYQVEPAWLGGCRPLRLRPFVVAAGFAFVQRWYVSQWGYPSEVVSAVKPLENNK